MIKGIKYICPRGTSGYSEAAKDYIIALNKHYKDIPLSVHYLKFDNSLYEGGERNTIVNSLVDKKIKYNKLILHSTPEHWPELIKKFKTKDCEVIGLTVWETDKLCPKWIEWINQVDKVIAPCSWNKEVFINSGITKPIEVISHVYKVLPEAKCKIKGVEDNEFVFYTIGQWSVRKGIDDTIKAYLDAFTNQDKVCLIVKVFRSSYAESEKNILRKSIQKIINNYLIPAKIILLLNELTDEQIAALHHLGNCYVTLHKAEGFGLGMFDAAGTGNPVISTGLGGQMDFLRFGAVDYKLAPALGMGHIPWYLPDQNWAKPDIENASKLMKEFYQNYNSYLYFADIQKRNIERNFDSETVANKLTWFLTIINK
jgi:glycosyltransferase involved in cell wall biosynthesis